MKKFMIVAAAITVAGIAGADNGLAQIYQATFNLKTTVGKSGSVTLNLGKDNTGTFWYQDPSLTNKIDTTDMADVKILDTTNFTFKTVKGQSIPVPTDKGIASHAIYTNLVRLAGIYDKKSANVYCYTFKGEACYRVAGTIKVSGWFVDDECLTWNGDIGLIDAFGAGTRDKSTKAEVYGADVAQTLIPTLLYKTASGAATGGGDLAEVTDNLKVNRLLQILHIAGHGAYGKVYDPNENKMSDPGVTSLSGYAVGLADQAKCVSCCAPDVDVVPFDCCGYTAGGTAVFGTFTIKYNGGQTKKLLY